MRFFDGNVLNPFKEAWKVDPPQFPSKTDVCWWVFTTEKEKWKYAEIKINFKKKGRGINILAYGVDKPPKGQSPGDQDKPRPLLRLFDAKTQPRAGVVYSMDSNFNLLIQAVPQEGSKDTDFEFEFYVEGVEWPYYLQGAEWLKN